MYLKDSKKDVKTREINLKIWTIVGEKEVTYKNVLWASSNRVWILYESDYGIMLENTSQGSVDYPILYDNGDVRGNYTEEFILKYDNEEDFYSSLSDCNKYWSYTDGDGVIWYCDINIFSDTFDISVENSFNYGYDYTSDIETYEDFIKYVNTRINEFKGIEE